MAPPCNMIGNSFNLYAHFIGSYCFIANKLYSLSSMGLIKQKKFISIYRSEIRIVLPDKRLEESENKYVITLSLDFYPKKS